MKTRFWWPSAIDKQKSLLQNFFNKIENYEAALALTPAQVVAMQTVCEHAIAAFNYVEGCKTSMQAATAWRNEVMYGGPNGTPAPAAPTFPGNAPTDVKRGLINSFMRYRDYIVNLPGYDKSIGEDLGLIGAEITPTPEQDMRPELVTRATGSYNVALTGSMQGMDAMRIEYATGDGPYREVGLFTSKPGTVHIEPQNPGQPENGRLRAVFIKKSHVVGNYSPNYSVTIY